MFPSTLSTFNRPTTTDRLNSPSHSALHNTVSSALGQVEAVMGARGDSSVVGTINSAVFSPGSTGGGHVQGAAFGGTGQTTFAKGDILVAQSASILSKLSVGANGQVLSIDSSQSSGIKWITPLTGKVFSSVIGSILINSSAETSIFSVSIPASTLGSSGIIRNKIFINFPGTSMSTGATVVLKAVYGGTGVASVIFSPQFNAAGSIMGTVETTMIGNGTTSAQNTTVYAYVGTPSILEGLTNFISKYDTNVSSVKSDVDQIFGMTAQWSTANLQNQLKYDTVIVESIT